MKSLKTLLKSFCVAAFLSAAFMASAQNLVQDPGFEASPDSPFGNPFSPAWTVNDPSGFSSVGGTGTPLAHSGNNYATLGFDPAFAGAMPPAFASLTQNIATVAGRRYNLDFWLANFVMLPTNFFQVWWNGAMVFSTMSPPFDGSGNYTNIAVTNLLATGASTQLQFRYRHDQDFWSLDDVRVQTVPEGSATLWIAAPLFAALCLLGARARRAALIS